MADPQLEAARYRSGLYGKIRNYFAAADVLEVETPLFSRGAATDRHIDLFRIDEDEKSVFRYLVSSPELYMKRLLSQGYPSIFQICKAFRKGERGDRHQPEFSILEWYRLGYSLDQLMGDVADLCRLALGDKPVVMKSYREAFMEQLKIDPLETNARELYDLIVRDSIVDPTGLKQLDKDDYLQILMSEAVEPSFPRHTMVFIHNYPASQAILSRVDEKDPRTALRFEMYYNGQELCNGFEELTDLGEYVRRFNIENQKRVRLGKDSIHLDSGFLKDMEKSFPDCSGVALGLDRLIMLALEKDNIQEVLTFIPG